MINNSNEIWLRADKSNNIYKCNPSKYHKILTDKITDTYKKDRHNNRSFKITKVMTKLTNSLKDADRMGKIHTKDAYILFEDHKPNFSNNTQSSIINPTKSKLGITPKNIIKKITDKLLITTDANLWKDSSDAIKWFVIISNVPNNNGPLTTEKNY